MSVFTRLTSLCFVVLTATACASVKVSMPGMGNKEEPTTALYSERIALNDAASDLGELPWGETPQSDMMSVLFGTVSDNARERTIKSYIADIQARGEDPVTSVYADADMSLAHARQVVEAGRQAVNAMTPLSSDITTLERAISDTRECRSIYVATLELLDRRGEAVSQKDVRVIKDAFSQTIEDMALTADLVADKVALSQGYDRYAERSEDQDEAAGTGGE